MTANDRAAPRESEPADAFSPAVYRKWWIRILVAAILFRAGILLYAEVRPERFDFPDSHRYILVARNLAAGNGPVQDDAFSGTDPLYPLLLSPAILLGVDNEAALLRFGRLVNAACGVASVLLLAAFARRWVGSRVALIAAGILAVDPILLYFNALVLTETSAITLLIATYYCLIRVREPAPLAWAMLAGICAGLAILLRGGHLFLPILLAPFVWRGVPRIGANRPATRPAAAGCFLLAAALMLSPTILRNYRLFGSFVPVRTGGGASLMEALGPWADGGPGMDRIIYPAFPPGADEVERDGLCRAAAIDWARSNPAAAARLAWLKLRRTWSIVLHAEGYASPFYSIVCRLTVAPVFALALVGAWLWRRRPADLALLLLPAGYFTLVHVVFVGSVRYRVPAMPFLFVLAAAAIGSLRFGSRRTGT